MKSYRKCTICRTIGLIEKSKGSRAERLACTLCDYWSPRSIIGSPIYVIILGIVGTVVTTLDILRTMDYKIPARYSSKRRGAGVVPPSIERDLKLLASILGIEHYTYIVVGAITEYPTLHTPWLLMQLCVILVEIVVFLVRTLMEGIHINRNGIIQILFAIFNWLQVFCLFREQVRKSLQ